MARDERATLLEVHQALPEEQFQSLKFLLEERVPAGLLLPASRPELCRMLLQRFPGNSLHVTAGILRQLGRLDLIQRFQLPLEEQTLGEAPREPNGNPSDARGDAAPGCRPGGIPAPSTNPRRLMEKDLMQIAQRLGREWQEVGILCLGLERSRLEQIQEENPSNPILWNFEMLREWRRREKHEATASRLQSCLEPARLDPGILDLLQSFQGD
ncbi:CRADD protein, partial [Menura novaehollandiae]|nr:CRADD protein [Menura novaehollandiae]